jgi:hypothetical protein
MRDGVLPAAVVAVAVIAFMAYIAFQGSPAVQFAVTGSNLAVVPADATRLARPGRGQVMLVDVSWQAGDSVGAGSYAVVVDAPRGWRHAGCRPECEWIDGEGLRAFGRRLDRRPYRLAAAFEAEQSGAVRVAFRSPRTVSGLPTGFLPTAWLVQMSGSDVLGAEQVPLSVEASA